MLYKVVLVLSIFCIQYVGAQDISEIVSTITKEIEWCSGKLTFVNGTEFRRGNHSVPKSNRGITGLVSFPGSGNTWVRYLLQQATGIVTGSVYNDTELQANGFPAESIQDDTVLVVKTHEAYNTSCKRFEKVILLVRRPDRAIVANFNRENRTHVSVADQSDYEQDGGREWRDFVAKNLKRWEETNLYWVNKFTKKRLIIEYEDLVNNLEATLLELLTFLDYVVSDERLTCILEKSEGIFRRKKTTNGFDPYPEELREIVDLKHKEVYQKMNISIASG